MKTNKKLLIRAKNLTMQAETPEQLYNLSIFTNEYIDKPTKNNKEVLEIYCDLIESMIELDLLEEKNKKIR